MRRIPLVLVLVGILVIALGSLVVAAGIGGGVLYSTHDGTDVGPVGPPDFDSAERLLLPPGNLTVGNGGVSVDPGHATSNSFARMQTTYEISTLRGELEAVDDPDDALELVRADVDEYEAMVDDAIVTEQAAYEQYARGDSSSAAFLAELGALYDRSAVLEEQADLYVDIVRGLPTPTDQQQVTLLRGDLSQLKHEVSGLRGPVKADLAADLAGESVSSSHVYLQASADGYTVSTTDGGVFTRQVYVAENRDRDGGSGFTDIEAAREATAALYPWTFEHSIGTDSVLRGGIYWVRIDHPHGTTTTYVDSGTERPFREIQETNLASVPTVEVATTVESDIAVTVDRTYAGGPAQVHVMDADVDEPIPDASVDVDDRPVTSTDETGAAWFVTPGDRFVVTVEHGGIETSLRIWIPTASR